jgi:hypothetical protein
MKNESEPLVKGNHPVLYFMGDVIGLALGAAVVGLRAVVVVILPKLKAVRP